MQLSDAVLTAVVAGLSPFLIVLGKQLLNARKARNDSAQLNFKQLEERNEFLTREIDSLRDKYDTAMRECGERYEALRDKYGAEREKVIRLETRAELRRMMRDDRMEELPRHAEGQLDFMREFQTNVDAIVFANREGVIIGVNPKACALFGYSEHELDGKPLEILMPESYRAGHRAGMDRLRMGMPSRIVGKTVRLEGLKKRGTVFPIDLTVQTFDVDGRLYFAGVMRVAEDIPSLPQSEAPRNQT